MEDYLFLDDLTEFTYKPVFCDYGFISNPVLKEVNAVFYIFLLKKQNQNYITYSDTVFFPYRMSPFFFIRSLGHSYSLHFSFPT